MTKGNKKEKTSKWEPMATGLRARDKWTAMIREEMEEFNANDSLLAQDSLFNTQNTDSLENKDSEQISYKQAARLFERGLEMDNVIEQAGITRSEAKLMDMFQRKQAVELED